MKLFIVTALKEYRDQATVIFKKAGILVFSATDIIGFTNNTHHNLLDDWFSIGDARFDSILLFSFTGQENAALAMNLIQDYNQQQGGDFPLRAFILSVDTFSH